MKFFLPDREPLLSKLEVEEVYEFMKNNSVDDINQAWLTLFLRQPSNKEVDLTIKRIQDGGDIRYKEIMFRNQTNEIADAYRYQYGPFFSIERAKNLCNELFAKPLTKKMAKKIKQLIKQPDPTKPSMLYKWIADEIKLLRQQQPTYTLEDAYDALVLREPYDFELKLHQD